MSFKLFGDLILRISYYDKLSPFSIGFRIFLLAFVLVFLAIYSSNLESNKECFPPSQASNAERILINFRFCKNGYVEPSLTFKTNTVFYK